MFKNGSFPCEDLPSAPQSTNGSEEASASPDTDHNPARSVTLGSSVADLQDQQTRSFVEDINRRVNDLIENINNRRTSDLKVIDGFQEMLVEKVTEVCQQMKEHMYKVYETNSNEMQGKLQELSLVLESCRKLSGELEEAIQELTGVREELDISNVSQS